MQNITVDSKACLQAISHSHNIIYTEEWRQSGAVVQTIERGGALVTFEVQLGRFRVKVRLLNLPFCCEK